VDYLGRSSLLTLLVSSRRGRCSNGRKVLGRRRILMPRDASGSQRSSRSLSQGTTMAPSLRLGFRGSIPNLTTGPQQDCSARATWLMSGLSSWPPHERLSQADERACPDKPSGSAIPPRHRPKPWDWPLWQYCRRANRWDDPTDTYRVLYASTQRRATFLETLARFRPDPAVIVGLAEISGDDESALPPGPCRSRGSLRGQWVRRRPISKQRWPPG
jgi:hypothetical protein